VGTIAISAPSAGHNFYSLSNDHNDHEGTCFAKYTIMNKFFLSVAILTTFFLACDSQEGDKKKAEIDKNVSRRNYSINRSNSYSDLFLDSLAMEKFIAENKLNDSIIRRMRSFYNTRNYQFAWFSSEGLTEQARSFWNLHEYVSTYDLDPSLRDKSLQKRMDRLIAEGDLAVSSTDKSFVNTELKLTQHLIQYVLNNYEKGFVQRKEMERLITRKKEDVMYLADSLVSKKHKDDKYVEDMNEHYRLLKDQLAKYLDIAKQGAWPQITTKKKSFKKGSSSDEIAIIRSRLQASGDLPPSDSGRLFNDAMEIAVKNYQLRHGLKPDGIINAALIKEMNVPVEKRLQQIVMNMERMRWMPTQQPMGNLIMVNIPEFVLHMYENGEKVFDMDVVVGKEGTNTMMFFGDLNQVVFSPYWNIPQSIVRNEILPALEKNPDYLASQNMEQTGTDDGLPLIRQRPGPGNALGKVKFLFPNSFVTIHHIPH
jgi:murein L,D-transpeptidase YcbB/YkuD